MKIDLLVPSQAGDTLVSLTKEIARLNEVRLTQEGHQVTIRTGDRCKSSTLQGAQLGEGIALFGHGVSEDNRAFPGTDGLSLFPSCQENQFVDRWFHAMACDSTNIAAPLLHVRPRCIVGYSTQLHPAWSFAAVSHEIEPAFTEFLTTVNVCLAKGVYQETELRNALRPSYEKILNWYTVNPSLKGSSVLLFCAGVYDHLQVHFP